MKTEALGRTVPAGGALEEVERGRTRRERLDAVGGKDLHGLGHARDLALLARAGAIGHTEHGDDQRHVGLDRSHHLAGGSALLADDAQNAVARLGERRIGLERLEGSGEPTAVALVMAGGGPRRRPPRPPWSWW